MSTRYGERMRYSRGNSKLSRPLPAPRLSIGLQTNVTRRKLQTTNQGCCSSLYRWRRLEVVPSFTSHKEFWPAHEQSNLFPGSKGEIEALLGHSVTVIIYPTKTSNNPHRRDASQKKKTLDVRNGQQPVPPEEPGLFVFFVPFPLVMSRTTAHRCRTTGMAISIAFTTAAAAW